MDPQQEERRGEEAKQLLANPLYEESWQVVRERIVVMLEQSGLKPEERERLNNALVGLKLANHYLKQVIATGTMAAMETQHKRSLADRILRRA